MSPESKLIRLIVLLFQFSASYRHSKVVLLVICVVKKVFLCVFTSAVRRVGGVLSAFFSDKSTEEFILNSLISGNKNSIYSRVSIK